MQLALVVGTAVATHKHPSFTGHKLLIVQPKKNDGQTPDGDPQIAIDGVGAGPGQHVIITSDGRWSRQLSGHNNTPVRWSVIGIRDA